MKNYLNKHRLDFEHAMEYVRDCLEEVNTLSSDLLNLLDIEDGNFFTLLPDDANLEQIYKFKLGGILPQNPIIEYFVEGVRSRYSIIPNIRKDLSNLMFDNMFLMGNLTYIFDDFNSDFDGVDSYDLFVKHGLHLNNEIYYYLNKSSVSVELINECLNDSNTFWHSLCVFTAVDFSKIGKKLNVEKIKEICLKTELFMVEAYDAEGYVFWEKSGNHFFENTESEA